LLDVETRDPGSLDLHGLVIDVDGHLVVLFCCLRHLLHLLPWTIALSVLSCYSSIAYLPNGCNFAIRQGGEMKKGWYDTSAFYDALDAARVARGLTWKQVAGESGVSASTLTRIAQGRRPDVDGLAALAAWSGLTTDDYVRSEGDRPQPEPLAKISTYLRSDKNLSPEAARALDALIKATYERLKREE
jgi:transcriptional regulator with XRE-family HTH domain